MRVQLRLERAMNVLADSDMPAMFVASASPLSAYHMCTYIMAFSKGPLFFLIAASSNKITPIRT